MKSKVAISALIAACSVLAAGCSTPNFQVLSPNVERVDVAEVAANLGPGQGMLYTVRAESLQSRSAMSLDNTATLTPGAVIELLKAGSALGSAKGANAALNTLAAKDRVVDASMMIADSADIRDMRISDNQTKLVQQASIIEVSNRVTIIKDIAVVADDIVGDVTDAPPVIEEPNTEAPAEPDAPAETNVIDEIDQVISELDPNLDFLRNLVWQQSINGSGASVTKHLRDVTIDGQGMAFDLDDLDDWPATGPAISDGPGRGVMCAAVFRNGRWTGGKFDHLRHDTDYRDFKNLCGYLSVCPQSGDPVRFFALSYDGQQASNFTEVIWP